MEAHSGTKTIFRLLLSDSNIANMLLISELGSHEQISEWKEMKMRQSRERTDYFIEIEQKGATKEKTEDTAVEREEGKK